MKAAQGQAVVLVLTQSRRRNRSRAICGGFQGSGVRFSRQFLGESRCSSVAAGEVVVARVDLVFGDHHAMVSFFAVVVSKSADWYGTTNSVDLSATD